MNVTGFSSLNSINLYYLGKKWGNRVDLYLHKFAGISSSFSFNKKYQFKMRTLDKETYFK